MSATRRPSRATSSRCPRAQALDGADRLQRLDARTAGLAETVDELITMDEPRRHLAALIHGLDITYDLGDGHPLLGRRMLHP